MACLLHRTGVNSTQYPGQQLPANNRSCSHRRFNNRPCNNRPCNLPGQPPPGQGQFNPNNPGAAGAANPGLNIINQLLTTPRPASVGNRHCDQQPDRRRRDRGSGQHVHRRHHQVLRWPHGLQRVGIRVPTSAARRGFRRMANSRMVKMVTATSQGFSGPGGASMPLGSAPGCSPPPPPGGFPAVPSLPPHFECYVEVSMNNRIQAHRVAVPDPERHLWLILGLLCSIRSRPRPPRSAVSRSEDQALKIRATRAAHETRPVELSRASLPAARPVWPARPSIRVPLCCLARRSLFASSAGPFSRVNNSMRCWSGDRRGCIRIPGEKECL